MTDDEKRRAAQAVLSIPFFTNLMDDLEAVAIKEILNAALNDDDTRRNAAFKAKAIQRIRQHLETISQEGQSAPVSRVAPA